MRKVGMNISDVRNSLKNAKLCLPEFQRDFVWKPRQIADLMMSVLRSYPIGWLLFLNYKTNKHIEPRPIADMKLFDYHDCRFLVIDGQQRLTSIYRVFNSAEKGIFEYRGKPYFLFLRVDKLSSGKIHDLDNDFIGVRSFSRKEKCIRYLDDLGLQATHNELAFWVFLDDDRFRDWMKKTKHLINKKIIHELAFLRKKLYKYDISYDVIHDKIENMALCNIFEKINTTGTKLNIFDLKVADFEKFGIDLRNLWRDAKAENTELKTYDVDPLYILKIIVLIKKALRNPADIKKITCEEKDINSLSNMYEQNKFETHFQSDWQKAVKYLRESLSYYNSNYGVDNFAKIPYAPMLIVYACMLWWISEGSDFRPHELFDKMSIWYWRSVFGQRYEKSTNTVMSNDFYLLRLWINESKKRIPKEFRKISDINLKQITSSRDAVYRGVLCLPLANKAQDIIKPRNILNSVVEDHHIFPKKWLERKGFKIKSDLVNCVLNRTYILEEVNVEISDKTPSQYFYKLSEDIYTDKLDVRVKENLGKHFIKDNALKFIRKNKFVKFLTEREKLIQKEIKKKTQS